LIQRAIFRSIQKWDDKGHGGNRRLAQIIEIIKRDVAALEFRLDIFGRGASVDMRSMISGLLWLGAPATRFGHPKALRNAGVVRAFCDDMHIDTETIVCFDSYVRGYAPIFGEIKRRGGKVVAFPQNLDSLTAETPDPMSRRMSPRWMKDEIGALSEADLICCISREEQWLLAVYGLPSLFLPYYPAQENRAALARIRTQRACSARKDKVLIMGTALNIPTLRGMQILLQHAAEIVRAACGREVILAGYGTEALKSADLPAKFRVLGGVSQEEMERWLVEAAVCLCFQPGTGGALTRISELLCAGVPVIANYVAARSYHNAPGVQVVESIDHLLCALQNFSPQAFAAPDPPEGLERELSRELHRL
jgi:hypothetical protein